MRFVVLLSLIGALLTTSSTALGASAGPPPAPNDATGCQFVLGFAALQQLIPQIVGQCLEDEHYNPANGDALQRTTGGLLVWRKADNWTAFTDGYHTWVAGPDGLQERLNTERFSWEANPDGLPVVATESSGIVGEVTLGPTTPTCQVGTPCSRPIAATINVSTAAGQLVTQFTTGPDGHFQVSLPPGMYTLTPAKLYANSNYPLPVPAKATVTAGAYTHVEVTYDTLIR